MSRGKGKELRGSTYRIYENDFVDKKTEYAVMNYLNNLSKNKKLSSTITKWIINGSLKELDEEYMELERLIEEKGIAEILKNIKTNHTHIDKSEDEKHHTTIPLEAFDYDLLSEKVVEKMIEKNVVMKNDEQENEDSDENKDDDIKYDSDSEEEKERKRKQFKNKFTNMLG